MIVFICHLLYPLNRFYSSWTLPTVKNEQTAPSSVVTNSLYKLCTPDIEFCGHRLLCFTYPTVRTYSCRLAEQPLRRCETLWSARQKALIAFSVQQARPTENVFHIALRRGSTSSLSHLLELYRSVSVAPMWFCWVLSLLLPTIDCLSVWITLADRSRLISRFINVSMNSADRSRLGFQYIKRFKVFRINYLCC